jgi:hypothetical protein
MAKLKAHGTELLRVSKEQTTADDSSTDWRRVTRAFFADGKILQKVDVHFRPDGYRPAGERYTYGWKLHSKLKKEATITMEQYCANVRARIASGAAVGWIVEIDSTPVVCVSVERIMAAIESGDNIGFCKECGAEADGCEPDARNYRCESCGAMAVYGAEEMLVSA